MLSTTYSSARRVSARRLQCLPRSLTTDSTTSHTTLPPPPPLSKPETSKSRQSRLYPRPRPAVTHQRQALPTLPASFGRNQVLPVPDSTRALLEDIVESFDAPIRYAFAYGSGVFEQAGYAKQMDKEDRPMLDFIFAVTHSDHWHSINMQQHPGHYPLHARVLGSSFVSKTQEISPGLWFNTFVPMKGVTIKYGVTTVDTLCADLLNWRTLYLAGRMHKPLRIIKDDARVRLTQQVNLTSALRTALLMLPESFTQRELFSAVAGISYSGDPRMVLPAENRGKVENMVSRQEDQFRELYWRLAQGLPGVRWAAGSKSVEQDTSPHARAAHLKKLPEELLRHVHRRAEGRGPPREADESAYWLRIAGDKELPSILDSEITKIVRYPATVQSLKGIVSAGVAKSTRYSIAKINKWWKGTSFSSSS
ncbi:Mmp37-domain-containing protein [Suillus clintonianus]|uniref:Mmp37-domain-containing protein n=1 Tax=Suillus clintonianus TaxID=1904413 RepID=UPI001B87A458|nr:Mmp37-domain-containing protein [Suillus clintonianus]KAG2126533.1 Mmp37-domain-containing protein [Suillus clintonianus]